MKLSILLPSYNNVCVQLVEQLQAQASRLEGWEYEIIVADDGGKDMAVKEENGEINVLPGCRYIVREQNVGRAAIRNFLAQQASGDWLMFLDSDVEIVSGRFLLLYIDAAMKHPECVIDGGVCVPHIYGRSNLRYIYELDAEPYHTVVKRRQNPFAHFHTANFMAPKAVMRQHRFDERFVRYGYEDVLFGKQLREAGINIYHIEAPVGLNKYESNISFVKKTEEGMRTLHFFHRELEGYSALLSARNRLERLHLKWVMKLFHKAFYPMLKLNLISNKPSLLAFRLYKLGFFCSL